MGATDYTTLISRIRPEVDDGAEGQLAAMETPKGTRDGVNTLFKLDNINILSGSIWYTYGTSYRQTTGFTLTDAVNGYLTITSAPDSGATQPFFFDYRFLWYPDSDYNKWIDSATEECGGIAGTATAEGLYPALIAFVTAKYLSRRASDYARKAMASGAGATDNLSIASSNYSKLAGAAYKKACDLRAAYYTRFDQRKAPSSYTITQGVSSFQPRR